MVDIESIKPKIRELAEKYGVSLIVLFGSQVKGKTHKESDFDIAYYSEKKLDFNEEIKLDSNLTDVFRSNEVQLINLKKASPLLAREITRDCIILFERKDNIFNDLLIYTIRMYDEARSLFRLRAQYVADRITKYQYA
ncbi:MAG: nucleotidyltransferase domain-containing protein [Candidatus Taylorbacteria bacterium]|nr:nucleotidyltransferase domain-containing protein [Candidatus Taylorbacteria bacterium]